MRSALAQEGASIELFVVGDGVEDDTRAALEPFLADPRVRFFDLPKGERHGERKSTRPRSRRPPGASSATSATTTCSCPATSHDARAARGRRLRPQRAVLVEPGDVLAYIPFDLAQAPQQARLRAGDWNAIGLTGAAHTLAAYRRLPWGWRPAPPDVLDRPPHVAAVPRPAQLPRCDRHGAHAPALPEPDLERASARGARAALASWSAAIHDPAGRRPGAASAAHVRRDGRIASASCGRRARHSRDCGAIADVTQLADLRAALATVESTRTWRLRNRLLALRPVRALAARLPAAR